MGMHERAFQREMREIYNRGLPKEVATTIVNFINEVSLELSLSRLYAYILRLRLMAQMIPDRFLNPSADDLKDVSRKIRTTKVSWGTGKPHLPT
ncbi:MAG: hypothetical protein ACP5UO_02950, partial [Thermoplasmata archaeon]